MSRRSQKAGRVAICFVVAFAILPLVPGSATATPLLVNTEAFYTINDDDTSANVTLRFGDTLDKSLYFDRFMSRFTFDSALYVQGDVGVSGAISGATLRARNFTVSGAVVVTSGASLTATTKALSGQVLVGRGTSTPVFRDPTGSLVWYVDGIVATGTYQGPMVTMPFGFKATGVSLRAKGAPTGAAIIVDIYKDGVTMFSTRPQINANATTGGGSAVFSTTTVTTDSVLSLSVTQVGSTYAGSGLTIMLNGIRRY